MGGHLGYLEFLEAMQDREHPQHVDMIHWYGKLFDPEAFSADQVKFWNPETRFKMAFEP